MKIYSIKKASNRLGVSKKSIKHSLFKMGLVTKSLAINESGNHKGYVAELATYYNGYIETDLFLTEEGLRLLENLIFFAPGKEEV